jgi:signal peptidase I
MNIDLPFLLVFLVLASGLICLVDVLFFVKKRKALAFIAEKDKMPLLVDYARSFFPLLLLVLVLRSFAFQLFKVPSGSLEPTVMPGDFIAVNMYKYGLRLPLVHKKILSLGKLKRGDIALFYYPVNPQLNFVKRVIGLPGDHISYINKEFIVNGQKFSQTFVGTATDSNSPEGPSWPVTVKEETIGNVIHKIYVRPDVIGEDFKDLVVPPNQYLMIGDNRDDSDDARYWGFVPDDYIIGAPFHHILFNLQSWKPDWHRIWKRI